MLKVSYVWINIVCVVSYTSLLHKMIIPEKLISIFLLKNKSDFIEIQSERIQQVQPENKFININLS